MGRKSAEPPKRSRGRPLALQADKRTLQILTVAGQAQCTAEQTGGMLGVSKATLMVFFNREPSAREAWNRGKLGGIGSLRVSQFNLAKRSAPMAIWLGKQHLGQTDPDRRDWRELVAQRNADNPAPPPEPMRFVAVFPTKAEGED